MTLKSNIKAFVAGMPKVLDDAVETTAQQIATTERQLVPVATGALKASIEVFGAGGSGERTVSAGQSLDYAPAVEYGLGHQAAQPFVTPAAEQHRPDLPRNVAAQLRALAKRLRV